MLFGIFKFLHKKSPSNPITQIGHSAVRLALALTLWLLSLICWSEEFCVCSFWQIQLSICQIDAPPLPYSVASALLCSALGAFGIEWSFVLLDFGVEFFMRMMIYKVNWMEKSGRRRGKKRVGL